jgi:hypothetical protein
MGVTQNKEMTMSITSKESLLMELVFKLDINTPKRINSINQLLYVSISQIR